MKINPINNVSYRGIPVAEYKVKGSNSCYRLYKLTKNDKAFLNKMYDALDVKKLMPKLKEQDYVIWDSVLKNAIDCSGSIYKEAFLETVNGKPCGLMNFREHNNIHHLNYIVTFPVKKGKKVPFAGQILFNHLFEKFLDSNNKKIELFAIKSAPFSPISKYLKLGFKMTGSDSDGFNEKMGIKREIVAETFGKQKEFIKKISLLNKKNVNLTKILNINYV